MSDSKVASVKLGKVSERTMSGGSAIVEQMDGSFSFNHGATPPPPLPAKTLR